MRVLSLGWEDPLEDEMATHSSILAWEILCIGKNKSMVGEKMEEKNYSHQCME